MKTLFLVLVITVIAFGQSVPNKIGKLSKSDFEKWTKPLVLEGYRFATFSHESDSYQVGYNKGTKTVSLMARYDDNSFTDQMVQMMKMTKYQRKGFTHFYYAMDEMTMLVVLFPKYKISISVGFEGKVAKDFAEKILDQSKILEK